MRFLFACFISMICYSGLPAQSLHQVGVSSAVQVFGERDRAFSPLTYEGNRTYVAVEYSCQSQSRSMYASIGYGEGRGESSGGNALSLWTRGAQWEVYYVHRRFRFLQFGWTAYAEFNKRQHEQFVNFSKRSDFSLTLGPAMRWHVPFQVGRHHLAWDSRAHVQALGGKVSSDYISPDPRTNGSDGGRSLWGVLQVIDPFYLGNDFRIGWDSSISFPVSPGSSLAIRYGFDWQDLTASHAIQRVRGNYSLVFRVQL